MSFKQNAILIFSAGPRKDLIRRGLESRFSPLLQIPRLSLSVTAQADLHLFTSDETIRPADGITIHAQVGTSFGDRLRNAIETLAGIGYSRIIVVGNDCPELSANDIRTALDQLTSHRLILGPDHRGGCYLIGFYSKDRHKLWNIHWQQNTDCYEMQSLFDPEDTYLLTVKHDIDSLEDIRILARSGNRWGALARSLIHQKKSCRLIIQQSLLIHLPTDRQRPRWQLPPPVFF